jgi:type IV pilus assembly protein PilM
MVLSWLTSRRRSLVGLDIGSSAVKAVQLQRSGHQHRLLALGLVPLAPEAIVDGVMMDAPAVSGAIRQLFEENRIAATEVAVSVSGHSVIVKKIEVPTMTKPELREAITWEAVQHIPYAIDDVNLDFQILEGMPASDGHMSVLLVAAKRDTVNEYLAVVSAAGLKAMVVDVDAFALENAFEYSHPGSRDDVVALVNIGAAVTTINIVRSGIPEFTRDSSLAGNRFTERLQKSLGVGYEQAEALKTGASIETHDVEKAAPVISAVTAELAAEMRRSCEFYAASAPDRTIDRVVMSGGCARLPNLASALSEALELPVEIANPLRGIQADSRRFDPSYLEYVAPRMAVAVGLALREPGDRA